MDCVRGLLCPKTDCAQGIDCSAGRLLTVPGDRQCHSRPTMPRIKLCSGTGRAHGNAVPRDLRCLKPD